MIGALAEIDAAVGAALTNGARAVVSGYLVTHESCVFFRIK